MRHSTFFLLFFLCECFVPPSFAVEAPKNKLIPRKILALYQYTEQEPDLFFLTLHQYAEMPLNHLGMEVVYHSVSDPLPNNSAMQEFRGIITWFKKPDSLQNPKPYCSWLDQQLKDGKYLVMLGEMGFLKGESSNMPDECSDMLKNFGVEYQGNYTDNPLYFNVEYKEEAMVEFERKIHLADNLTYSQFRITDPLGKSYLTLRRADDPTMKSAVVLVTAKGGYVYQGYTHYKNLDLDRAELRLNPFDFFEEALHLEGLPRPDVSLLNGRRLFYSQIDGDGIFNVSHIDRKSFSGEIILEKVLKKFSNLPITVSIITGYLDKMEFRNQRTLDLYKNMFSLPNVEPAAHGYAHPLKWQKGTVALKIPGYKLDRKKETAGAMVMLDTLLNSLQIPKQPRLYLWTGDCRPDEETIGFLAEKPWLNMNGGDSRMDSNFSSYAYVRPLGLGRGSHRQVYSGNSNENTYTHLWEGRHYGFADVLETFKNTESPRLIRPMDVYYHFYSGERHASLKALMNVYEYVLKEPYFPVQAGDYALIVDDFFKLEMYRIGDGFRILNRGHLLTIRFDNEERFPDLERSVGVIGYRNYQNNLYVYLDELEEHIVYFDKNRPHRPHFLEANFMIRNFSGTKEKIRFFEKGWGQKIFVLAGLLPNRDYVVDNGVIRLVFQTDGNGVLVAELIGEGPDLSYQEVTLTLEGFTG